MWTFGKAFFEFVKTLLWFIYVLVFWLLHMWGLSTQPRIKPTLTALGGEVLTTGLPGKSKVYSF